MITYNKSEVSIFLIGCFNEAPGCRPAGPASSDFTWFPGFRWRIACCEGCRIHLGWSFGDGGEAGFHGLILNRLATVEDDAPE